MQVSYIFYRFIVINIGNFAVVPGVCFMDDFSISYVNSHMADIASAVFIENQISGTQLAAADGTASGGLCL